MGYLAVVYGYVECLAHLPGSAEAAHHSAVVLHNLRAIESIPDADPEYPFLTRHMFALAMPRLDASPDRGLLRQIVHFGASIKVGMEDTRFSDRWLQKFADSVLRHLVWERAAVHFRHEIKGERVDHFEVDPPSLRAVLHEFSATGRWMLAGLKWTVQHHGGFRGREPE